MSQVFKFSRFFFAFALAVLLLQGCIPPQVCKKDNCEVRQIHMHEGKDFRAYPVWKFWKKQNYLYAEKQDALTKDPATEVKANPHTQPKKKKGKASECLK